MRLDADLIFSQTLVFGLAFLIVLLLGPLVIERLRVLKFGQNINTDAPERHRQKQGTPTMGGVLIVLGVALALLFGLLLPTLRPLSPQVVAVALVFFGHALLGFADDWAKIKRGKSLGLMARQKFAGQAVIAGLFVAWLYLTALPDFTTRIIVGPGRFWDLGLWYYPLTFLLMIGLSNAVNLTDGLDGLASGLSVLAALGLSWTVYAGFTQLPLIGDAIAGACLGFLWFNAHPAKVFMGDTGSLALGAALAAMGIVGKQEIVLLVLCVMFLIEIGSVMIQVPYFKMTGGKRVFRMTPIHHHFELLGVAETQVVARFWIGGVLALGLGLALAGWL